MPLSQSPKKETIFLGKNSKYTQEQNLALSRQPNTKTPEQLATENMPFVYHLVDKEFSIYYKSRGMSREDLVSAGMVGLVTAANRSKYGTFLRYASFWIRYYIYKEVRDCGLIRRPASFCGVLNKIRRQQESYKYSHDGEEPPMEWLMKATGLSEKVITDTLAIDEADATTVVSIEDLAAADDDGGRRGSIYDRIAADDGGEADRISHGLDVELAAERCLTEVEKRYVRLHYYDGLTVYEISRQEHESMRVVGRILDNALEKMKKDIEGRQ